MGRARILGLKDDRTTNQGTGKYRWRTWLRIHVPGLLARRIGKGVEDCGAHEWYNADDVTERCYHCAVGSRPRVPQSGSEGERR
jgi:hypothetical protein